MPPQTEFSQALAASPGLDDVLSVVGRVLPRLLAIDYLSISLQATGKVYNLSDNRWTVEKETIFKLYDSERGRVMVLPLQSGGETIGTLNISTHDRSEQHGSSFEIIHQAAAEIGLALGSALVRSEIARRKQWADVIGTLGQIIRRGSDLKELFADVSRLLRTVIEFDRSAVCLTDGDSRMVQIFASHSFIPGFPPEQDFPLEGSVSGQAIINTRILTIDDLLELPDSPGAMALAESGARSILTVPLQVGGRFIGALDFISQRPATFGLEEQCFASQVAWIIGGVIENFRLLQREQEKVARLMAIADVTRKLTSTLDEAKLFRETVDFVAHSLGYPAASILILDESGQDLLLRASAGHPGLIEGLPPRVPFEGKFWEPARAGSITVCNTSHETPQKKVCIELGIQSEAALPLKVDDRVVGLLHLASSNRNSLDAHDAAILQILSDHLAIALHNSRLFERFRNLHVASIKALAAAVDARDPYTHGHSARVSEFAAVIATEIELPPEQVEMVRFAGLLHDIGKIGISDQILRKVGPLDPIERAVMMSHPASGAAILEKTQAHVDMVPLIRHHHEWFAGGGYPDGISGDRIPLGARILAVADALDAMISDRPYRLGLGLDQARDRLIAGQGVQFDPQVVQAFIRASERGRINWSAVQEKWVHRQVAAAETSSNVGQILPVHGKELSIIYRIGLEMRSILNLSHLLHRILTILYDAMGPNMYFILLTEEVSGDLMLEAVVGTPAVTGRARIPKGAGVTGWVAEHGETQLVREAKEDPRFVQAPGIESRSALYVPLTAEGHTIGVLAIESKVPDAFCQDDLLLVTAVAGQISTAVQVSKAHDLVAQAAFRDGLTGLHNYPSFYRRLDEEITRAGQQGDPIALVIFDVDDLKIVNDSAGHLAGDEALREIARCLEEQARDCDTVARYGGDEFALILPGLNRYDAIEVVRRIMEDRASRCVELDGRRIPMPGISWGVATYPGDGTRAAELVKSADSRMYRRKGSRRVKEGKDGKDDGEDSHL